MSATSTALLEVRDVKKAYPVRGGGLPFTRRPLLWAVAGVSFSVGAGETFGLVGESGSGKSTVARLVLRLEEPTEGALAFAGQDLGALSGPALKDLRRRVQAVFQDPQGSLNPRMRVRDFIAEPLVVHTSLGRSERQERVAGLLRQVALPPDAGGRYPHEFSGGQRQRICIARALACGPSLLVLDEPVSALDVSIRAQILNLLSDLQDQLGLTYLFIAHDLAVVEHMSSTVGVMYLGKLMEVATSTELFRRPLHPYTRALMSAVPATGPDATSEEIVLEGEIPSPIRPPSGCRFRTRCWLASRECAEVEPELREIAPGHHVACIKV